MILTSYYSVKFYFHDSFVICFVISSWVAVGRRRVQHARSAHLPRLTGAASAPAGSDSTMTSSDSRHAHSPQVAHNTMVHGSFRPDMLKNDRIHNLHVATARLHEWLGPGLRALRSISVLTPPPAAGRQHCTANPTPTPSLLQPVPLTHRDHKHFLWVVKYYYFFPKYLKFKKKIRDKHIWSSNIQHYGGLLV